MIKLIKQKDPELFFDEKNNRRIFNYYKIIKDKKLRSQKKGKNIPLFDILFIYLDIERNILKKRVEQRLNNMLLNGFIQEVISLIRNYPKANFNVIGYKEIKLFLEKKISLLDAKNLIIKNTMNYAKRQKTWFKNQILNLVVLNALDKELLSNSVELIKKFLKKEK
ncbi:hypothetical protein FEF22_000375 [Texas Phoenix palm phytoplasma]|uniref:tRNA dimethylallyltransferase n=2 Tax=Texas Phoenix palm phytoplasma TaxID=176709 RepID=A0ABS5BI34_9MOLU|nr:hypothetical protein [Texas Phoenix palm phytoplasma]